jgi:pimeloyl-ACP methyl ester carboxylesterase
MGRPSKREPLIVFSRTRPRAGSESECPNRSNWRCPVLLKLGSAILTALAFAPWAMAGLPGSQCAPNYFQLADGSGVDIAPSTEGHLRWRKLDGTSGLLSPQSDGKWSSTLGWTGHDDGKIVDLSDCDRGVIRFAGVVGHKVDFENTEASFKSGDVQLAGRLVLPPGRGTVPIVVLVHGSEDESALRNYVMQRLLPAQGVGVFVYDKRGTGDSKGVYTHDYYQLAADANAGLITAKSLAGARAGRIGFYGTSQGGWVAPLAASFGHADFVIVGFGLAVSPVDEDREALELDMTSHGFGPAEIAKALEIGTAVHGLMRSRFQFGYDTLAAVTEKYKNAPWFKFVRGDITGIVIHMPEATIREQGPRLVPDIIADYDPMPVLRGLKTPQLWVLG